MRRFLSLMSVINDSLIDLPSPTHESGSVKQRVLFSTGLPMTGNLHGLLLRPAAASARRTHRFMDAERRI
jgi:hypothetical protein